MSAGPHSPVVAGGQLGQAMPRQEVKTISTG